MKTLTQAAQAAKLIRKDLKKAYPNTKFSVTSSNFSMGDSVRISWNLGPTIDKINAIVDKYQYGHFDGMTDSYEYSNCKSFPQTKFVQTQRDYCTQEELENFKLPYKEQKDLYLEGKAFVCVVAKDLCSLIGIDYADIYQVITDDQCIQGSFGQRTKNLLDCVHAIIHKSDMMSGYKGLRREVKQGKEIPNSFVVIN